MGVPRFLPALVAVSLISIALTGCTTGSAGYPIFDRAAQPEDTTPTSLPDYARDNIDLITTRYVGEHHGTQLWLGKGREAATVCLLAYPDDHDWVIGCGGEGQNEVYGVKVGRFVFQPDEHPAPEDSEAISDNVYFIHKS